MDGEHKMGERKTISVSDYVIKNIQHRKNRQHRGTGEGLSE